MNDLCAIDGDFQSFLDDIGIMASAYGLRALILGNLVGMSPKDPQTVFNYLIEHCLQTEIDDESFTKLADYFNAVWNKLLTSIDQKELPLLSPYPKQDILTEMLLIHLSTRLEEISYFFTGLNIGDGFLDDDEEHEDVMDKLELFIVETDNLLTECETNDNYDTYHDKTLSLLGELDESWHEVFDVIFEII